MFAFADIAAFIIVCMLKAGYGILADEDPYLFAPEEMERFERRRRLYSIRGGGSVNETIGLTRTPLRGPTRRIAVSDGARKRSDTVSAMFCWHLSVNR